jgi:hypothetical protein
MNSSRKARKVVVGCLSTQIARSLSGCSRSLPRGSGSAANYAWRKRSASHDSMSSSAAFAIAVGCSVKPWGDSG